MDRPEWAPSTKDELYGNELVSYWQDQAIVWRRYSRHLESKIIRMEADASVLAQNNTVLEASLEAREEYIKELERGTRP